MTESRPTRLAGWWGGRHLQLSRLDPGPRRAAVVGLALAAAAGLAMVMPTWPGVVLDRSTCTASPGRQVAALAGAAASLAALAYGLSLVAAAATAPGARTWPLPRTRFLLTLLLPTVLVLASVVVIAAPSPSWVALAANHVRGAPLFVAMAVLVAVAAATRGRGPAVRWGVGLVVATGTVAVVWSVVVTSALAGLCAGVLLLGGALTVLGFFGLAAVPVLLVWLATEGLRLSGSLATWAMDRRPERRLLAVLLGAKLAAVLVAVALVATGAAPPWLAAFRPPWSTWLFAGVLVALVCVLLSAEERLVGSSPDDYALVTRWFTGLVASAVLFLPVTGIGAALGGLSGRPLLVLALVTVAGGALLAGLGYRRRGPVAVVAIPLALVTSYGLLARAWLGPRAGPAAAGGPDVGRTLLLAGVPLLAVTVATVVLLVLRPRWRRHITFGVGLLAWIALNVGLPTVTGGRLGSSPVAFDLLLTGVVAVLAVAGRLGWQRSVTPDELVLLLVTTSVIIELPLLIGVLPDALTTPLLLFAFLSPGLAAVTLEAGPLNDDPADAPHRIHTVIGLVCVGYGLVAAMALAVRDPLGLMQQLVGFFNGVVAVPFAIVLVAVLSANRQRAARQVA